MILYDYTTNFYIKARGEVWISRQPPKLKIGGSNPRKTLPERKFPPGPAFY